MPNIYLTGFSYTGKSAVARSLARKLGWKPVDTDASIVRGTGRQIPDIFAQDGEPAFRQLEKEALREAGRGENVVVATGGGVASDPDNQRFMAESGVVICLEARPEAIVRRMKDAQRRSPLMKVRPLIVGDDPLENVRSLKAQRQFAYSEADWTVHTDNLTLGEVVDEAIRGYRLVTLKRSGPSAAAFEGAGYTVTTESASYPGYVGWGILGELGARMRQVGLSGSAYIVADHDVAAIHGDAVEAAVTEAGFSVERYEVDPGEASKTLATAEAIYGWLAAHRAERGHCIVSLGGGMAGDLAGFVAATYLRGMALVHVPTSLLAMVDASLGGKVAVDLPAGKNLVGAFHQPRLVFSDARMLTTLPKRELTSGWAELIKHGLILDPKLFEFLRKNRECLLALDPDLTTEAIRWSAAVKARVVSEDEKETKGLRTLLNYGHTVGHALEVATGYQGLLHGEAVAIGMTAAADISRRVGLLDPQAVTEQRETLEAYGLFVASPAVDLEVVRQAMKLDKKVSNKAIRWVLLKGIGQSLTKADVPEDVVEAAIGGVVASL